MTEKSDFLKNPIEGLETIKRLQNDAAQFLSKKILTKGATISPKEVESYYFKVREFEDSSVHRNELQMNNKNHFYVHRYGLTKSDKYKGGNRAGLDFVVSDEVNIYYSYLIRSAMINDELIVGPNKVLKKILEICNISCKDLESVNVELVENNISGIVLFSERINLGKNACEFRECNLRAVVCDEFFKESKYPNKEKMVIDFLDGKDNEYAQIFAKDKLGYIPSKFRKKNSNHNRTYNNIQ